MIDFHRMNLEDKQRYDAILMDEAERGCEYSFANKYLWGKQEMAELHGCLAFFSHFHGRSVYPYPIGTGDRRAVIEALLDDARQRGIPCRITSLTQADREELESWFPGHFYLCSDRDSFDYVYDIHSLADLRGRKYQKKRNHYNRFLSAHPDYQIQPITAENQLLAQQMVADWYQIRKAGDPEADFLLESIALSRAFNHYDELQMEGIMLVENCRILAISMGSRLSADTFDIHFEKALEDVEGAYNAVNCEFARYLRMKYPEVKFLNREDDMGLEGLRKAKLSYQPHHMVEKYWAYNAEDVS